MLTSIGLTVDGFAGTLQGKKMKADDIEITIQDERAKLFASLQFHMFKRRAVEEGLNMLCYPGRFAQLLAPEDGEASHPGFLTRRNIAGLEGMAQCNYPESNSLETGKQICHSHPSSHAVSPTRKR